MQQKTNLLLPLTIVTAVLNEEENLPAFLDHVTKIAQEVIVVIDFRTYDASEKIVKQFGCKVLMDKGESQGVVFNNKNWGIDQASHAWVFIMDADERISEELYVEIKEIVTGKMKTDALMFQTGFINYEFGRFFVNCDQSEKKFIRLFKKGSFRYQTSKTSEGFDIQVKAIPLKKRQRLMRKIRTLPGLRSYFIQKDPRIENLNGLLIHNSHPTIHDFVRKIDLYSSREAKIFLNNRPHPSRLFTVYILLLWPVREFLYKYFIWQFYKEGVHGFIASIMYGFYRFMMAAKIYSFHYKRRNSKYITKMNEFNFVGLLDET
jgi:glycosyltransferase involved in cell wall biosynthesis